MKVLIFDTETTGLIENHTRKLETQPEITEFYGHIVDLKTGKVGAKIDQLFQTRFPISAEITKITGITNDMIKGQPAFAEKAKEIQKFIQKAPVVLAHNLSFDMEMVDIEMERCEIELKWPKRRICTVESTVHLKGFRLSQTAMYDLLFKETFAGAHRARIDVEALTRCCVELFKRGVI